MKNKIPIEDRDTYFSRQEDALDEAGGRYALDGPRKRIIGRDQYPEVAETPLTTQPPDHAYNPDRDRIAPEDITTDKFGQDLKTFSGAPPEASVSPPPATSEEAPCPSGASSAFKRRI